MQAFHIPGAAPLYTNTFLLISDAGHAVVIDPAADAQTYDKILKENNAQLTTILCTHGHYDHVGSAAALKAEWNATLYCEKADLAGDRMYPLSAADCGYTEGEQIAVDELRFTAWHTPGHTPGSQCFLLDGRLVAGDTLFLDGCGRTDFQSGSASALYRSITQVLFALPGDTLVWPGHDYQGRSHSSIGAEKTGNARVAGRSEAEFVTLMEGLQLPRPQRMDEAVPANLHSGLRHDADGASLNAPRAAEGYVGDISAELAWQWVQNGQAVLIDVRSDAERAWVGEVPGAVAVAWKQWPGMAMNPDFDAQLRAAVPAGGAAVLLCRSGVRSVAAAQRATQLGITAYNILEGFEGDPDSHAQRGKKGGWRRQGLPWRQG